MTEDSHSVGIFSAGLSAAQRLSVIQRFREGSLRALIIESGCERGLDVEGVTLVVNFNLPEDNKTYLHWTFR
jgi:superfamily II DNA/RNA helicase